jgi:8-oxo-dGTP pyrophosphatase MutT (NUDIX family)
MQDSKGKNFYELVWLPLPSLNQYIIHPERIKNKLTQEESPITSNPIFTNIITHNNNQFKAIGYNTQFKNQPIENIKQVYGIILNSKNQLLLVKQKSGLYLLPGGGRETGESLLQTLQRELMEEAAITIDLNTIQEGFWQQIYKQENDQWILDVIQVRYCVRLKSQLQFIVDPDGGIIYQIWIDIDKLNEYLDWGSSNETIKQIAQKIRKPKLN